MRAAARALILLLASGPSVPAQASGPTVAVVGSEFRVTLPDGRALAQSQLPGIVVTLGDGSGASRRIRVDAVEPDPSDPAGEVMLYTMSEPDPATGEWRNACQPGPDGRRQGFPLPGSFTPDGTYVPAPDRLLITCTGGAEGKCVRFGYKPWRSAPDGASLLPYYQACTRLVRADYGGDGVGHTRNGTRIDLFDRIGIQADEPAAGMMFEAAFAPQGAVCVAHPRWPDLGGLPDLAARYPRLAGQLGANCDEHASALLFVRSFPQPAP
jgi:ADYC domain